MTDEAKGKEPQEKEESATLKKKVTSWMLLNKFERDQERRQYREETDVTMLGHLQRVEKGELAAATFF